MELEDKQRHPKPEEVNNDQDKEQSNLNKEQSSLNKEQSNANKDISPDNQSTNKPKEKKKSSSGLIISIVLTATLLSLILYFVLVGYYGTSKSSPTLYSKYFFYWRIKYADIELSKVTGYKGDKLNTIDPKNKTKLESRKIIEDNTYNILIMDDVKNTLVEIKGLLKAFNISDHAPRGISNYDTHTTGIGFYENADFLMFRAIVLANLGYAKDDFGKMKEFDIAKASLRSKFPIKKILALNESKIVTTDFVKNFHKLLDNIYSRNVGYVLTNNNSEIPNELIADISTLLNEADFEKKHSALFTKQNILNFFIHFGKIHAVTALDSFIYSRFFNLFYLLTLHVELQGYTPGKNQRVIHISRMFANIFSRVYSASIEDKVEDKDVPGWIEYYLGKTYYDEEKFKKSLNDKDVHKKGIDHDDANIKNLLKELGALV